MSLIAELKRRNVFRVGVAYAIVAWLLIEVASVVLPTFKAPEWVLQVCTFLVIFGFPLALILAWAFELTPEGIKLEKTVDRAESIKQQTGRKLDFAIIGLLVLAVVYFAVDKFVLQADPETVNVAAESIAQEKTIAVLPFANMSGDPEQEFFSDGISEELLNVLAKVKGLRVTSRTSAFAFKGKDISIPEIAQKLGVKHVLEGSVRMAGDRVRITTQLIEVETDSHLWSQSYDRDLSDIFAVQDEIAAKVGEALKVALLGADSKPVRTSSETSIDVYSDYLLARQKLADPDYEALAAVERLLKSVIERDPEYAPAYAALAHAYDIMGDWGMMTRSEELSRMLPLAEKALSFDDRLAEGWLQLSKARRANGDLDGARAALERARELDPRNPLVLSNLMLKWQVSREPERGLTYADELLRVDPLSPLHLHYIALFELRLGRFAEAERTLDRIRSIDPKSIPYLWGAWVLAISRGDLVGGIRFLEDGLKTDPADYEYPSHIAMHYFELGDVIAAKYWSETALKLDPRTPLAKLVLALLHLDRDEEAKAVKIARELTQPGALSRPGSLEAALRIANAPKLAAGDYEEISTDYLTDYPELRDGNIPYEFSTTPSAGISVTLDLASVYLQAGKKAKAESLLSAAESEIPHWPQTAAWHLGYGFANVDLHVLRGDREKALVALREGAANGTRYMWRLQLLYNPNLEPIRDTPEFAAVVAEIEADMAQQLARVREMERNGELEPIPEVSATTH
ncbi:MAG: tetratricopeptide repeat protein [Pseudomonadales bacterium]